MKRIFFATPVLFVAVLGCATNSFVGHGRSEAGQFFGSVGITGHRTNLTIENGSKVPKLSIIGDDCTVTVEKGADLGRIQVWGNGNTVSVPGELLVYLTEAGKNNVLHRRSEEASPAVAQPTKPGEQIETAP